MPLALLAAGVTLVWILHEDYRQVYQADYVGSEVCGGCHLINYQLWKQSPHHKITQSAVEPAVVGNFDGGQWFLPEKDRKHPLDQLPAVKTYQQDGEYYMALRYPDSGQYYPFKVERVVGYQYRQTYLTMEAEGVLRRLPLQWSVPRGAFFAYWNEQEQSVHSVADLWAQMKTLNSAWNLYCARCHTTNLDIISKDRAHTSTEYDWTEPGVGCESCHGPGSEHILYMADKPANRLMSFFNQLLNEQKAPYIMNAAHLEKGVG
ncbi:MAG: hypothetical protein HKN85_05430, partial [Gammaproteobacteria bacterium]|nr:hypothetical protein [Gammaproteobacteria bacterium]